MTFPYMTAVPFGVSGFQMPKRICPQDSRSSESRFPDMTSAGPTMELSTLSGFQTSHFQNARGSCPQDSRSVESRYADGLSPFGNFPEGLDCCHASPQNGRSSDFAISGFQTPKCLWVFTLETPKVSELPKCRWLPISTTCPNQWTTQICFRVFILEIPDPLSSRLPISRFPKSRWKLFRDFLLPVHEGLTPSQLSVRSDG
jgi:hypothetical protein